MSPIPGPPIVSTTLVQFVDSIDPAPTVRLDLNDSVSFKTLSDGTTFNPPPLREAIASNMLSHGEYVSASSYGDRAVVLHLRLKAADEDGLRNLLRVLMVELNRDSNILRLQIASDPVFFLTKRSTPGDIDITDWGLDTCTVSVSLRADPFAYGLRVDQAAVSVKTNPAVANGCYLDVNGVSGDVPTPAYVQLYLATAVVPSTSYLSVRRHGIPANLGFVYQAEAGAGLTTGTTITGSNDAQASGAGNNTLTTVSPATTPNFYITPTEGAEIRGTYRVLARTARTVFGDAWQLGVSMNSDWSNFSDWVSCSTTATDYAWTDLGLITLPGGEDAPTGYSGVYPSVSTTIRTYFGSRRLSGTGSLLWDAIVLMPADEDLAVFKPTQQWSSGSTSPLVLDGPNDSVYPLASSATFNSTTSRAGSIPSLAPGSNRLFLVENITTATLAGSSTVAVSYWPRYLTV